MNAFDLVVTVASGFAFASAIPSGGVSVVEAFAAVALICALEYAVAFLSVRSKTCQTLVESEPSLLFHRGRFPEPASRALRVSKDEIPAALRSAGATSPSAVDAVVLETDGSFRIVPGAGERNVASLLYVQGQADEISGRNGGTRGGGAERPA